MQYTIADGIVLLVIAVSGFLAFSRGFTREALAIGGWILAAVAALYLAPPLEPILKEIPTVGPILEANCNLSKLVAFAAVFAIALIVLSIFTPLFSSAVRESPLGAIDKSLGFLFGVARGVVLVAVAWLVYAQIMPPAERLPAIENARSVTLIQEAATLIEQQVPDTVPDWIKRPVNNLTAECGGFFDERPAGLQPAAPAGTEAPAAPAQQPAATGNGG